MVRGAPLPEVVLNRERMIVPHTDDSRREAPNKRDPHGDAGSTLQILKNCTHGLVCYQPGRHRPITDQNVSQGSARHDDHHLAVSAHGAGRTA
jgi:hypothetical protein